MQTAAGRDDGSEGKKCDHRSSKNGHRYSEEVREALQECTTKIVEAVHSVLEKTPPELAADIVDRGIVLTGGGSLLDGFEEVISQRTGINTMTAENPACVVAEGTGRYAEVMEELGK